MSVRQRDRAAVVAIIRELFDEAVAALESRG
jgi:hypothetical protein